MFGLSDVDALIKLRTNLLHWFYHFVYSGQFWQASVLSIGRFLWPKYRFSNTYFVFVIIYPVKKKIKGTWNLNFAIENILSYLKMVIFQASNNDSVKSWNTFFHGEKSAFRQHCDRLMSLFGLNTLKVRMEIERYRNITHFVFTQKFQKEAKRYYFVDEKIGKWYSFKLNIYFVSKAPKFRNFFLFKIFFYFSWGHFSNIQYQRF